MADAIDVLAREFGAESKGSGQNRESGMCKACMSRGRPNEFWYPRIGMEAAGNSSPARSSRKTTMRTREGIRNQRATEQGQEHTFLQTHTGESYQRRRSAEISEFSTVDQRNMGPPRKLLHPDPCSIDGADGRVILGITAFRVDRIYVEKDPPSETTVQRMETDHRERKSRSAELG
ncbi:hypothetical protein B0H14DRAFT_2642092 [Mycena olivaceomarginata]|nr:hypothetical protein B0H14DRAFT_2642092 [Mycena olivaceomarginata]